MWWPLIVAIILSSLATVSLCLLFLRWVKGKQRRVHIPSPILEELNHYAELFQRVISDMRGLTRRMESRHGRNQRIVENLKEMNQLLQKMHRLFEEQMAGEISTRTVPGKEPIKPAAAPLAEQPGPAAERKPGELREEDLKDQDPDDMKDPAERLMEDLAKDGWDFNSLGEVEKFRRLPRITADEIRNIDWDELQRRFGNG